MVNMAVRISKACKRCGGDVAVLGGDYGQCVESRCHVHGPLTTAQRVEVAQTLRAMLHGAESRQVA